MRICLYTSTALPRMGGQELVVDALARQYQARGHEVVVLAPRGRGPVAMDDAAFPYRVTRHPRFISTRRLVAPYAFWLLRLHGQERFDVIHCHSVYPPGYLAGLNRQRLAPLVITSHGEDVYEGFRRLKDPKLRARHVAALAAADALVAISRFTHEGYQKLCPDVKRIADIPNGVHVDAFARPVPRPHGLDPQIEPGRYFLFLGRLHLRKGIDVLLNAWARLSPLPSVRLVIVGDGTERAGLEALAAELKISDRVSFAGWAYDADKAWLLQHALAVVVPSRDWEAFGLVVTESFAAGRPVIVSQLPGLCDLVQPGQTGWIVPPESPEPLEQAIADALADPARLDRMGAMAARTAREYSWDRVAERHLELYAELLANSDAVGGNRGPR